LLFARDPRLGLRFLLFAALSILLITVDYHKNYFASTRNVLATLIAPLQYLVDKPIQLIDTLTTHLTLHETLVAENARLHTQQILLQIKLQQLIALQKENDQLRALLAAPLRTKNERVAIARLLAIANEPLASEIVLDKGQSDNVYAGQPVVDAKGIVGQVIQVGHFTSRVLLITDLRSAVPVQDVRNGVRGIIVGRGNLVKLALTNIPVTVDVKIGDLLVSSGLGGHYPEGYPVGVITQIHYDPGEQFITIEVTPSAELDRNQQVVLIWPPATPTIDVVPSQPVR